MRSFRSIAVAVFVAAAFVFASNGYAADKNTAQNKPAAAPKAGATVQDMRKNMEQRRQNMWDQLNLTPEQKKQMTDNGTKNREAMKATAEKLRTSMGLIREELVKPELDMKKINSIQSEIKTLQGQMMDDRLNSTIEVRKVLTKEQFEKFLSLTGGSRPAQPASGMMTPPAVAKPAQSKGK